MAYTVTLRDIRLTIFVVDMQQVLNIMSVFRILHLFCYFLYVPCWLYYIFPLHILKGEVFKGKKSY